MNKNLPYKILQLKKPIIGIAVAFTLLISLFISTETLGPSFSPLTLSPLTNTDPFSLTDPQNYQGLPVGKVKSYPVPHSLGTVIYLPQYHRSPGSSSQDKINDAGAKSQEQLYQIIKFLKDKAGVNLAMVEGSAFREVPAEKIALLADKIERRNELVSLSQSLKNAFQQEDIDPASEKKFIQSLDQEIIKIDREINLEGAAERLTAEGENFKLYGAENEATQQESKLVLRDYIYLTDRLKQLDQSPAKKSSATIFQDSSQISYLKNIFKKNFQPDFNSLESMAHLQGREDLATLLHKTEEVFYALTKDAPEKIIVQTSSDTPSRKDNPYQNITDKKELQEKLSVSKDKVEQIIVERRNKETAENFTKALKDTQVTLGILQFGAGHEEGLVKELNKQGLSVIVLTPNEVLSRQSHYL